MASHASLLKTVHYLCLSISCFLSGPLLRQRSKALAHLWLGEETELSSFRGKFSVRTSYEGRADVKFVDLVLFSCHGVSEIVVTTSAWLYTPRSRSIIRAHKMLCMTACIL